MPNKTHDEELFDILLRQTIETQAAKEDDELENKYANADRFETSKVFDNKIQKVVAAPRHKVRTRSFLAVAMIVILLIAFFVTPAAASFSKWARSLFDQQTSPAQLDARNLEAYDEYVSLYYLLDPSWDVIYIPNSKYTEHLIPNISVFQTDMRGLIKLDYDAVDYYIYIDQEYPVVETSFIDNELGDVVEVDIQGFIGYMRQTEESIHLAWSNETTSFVINTNLSAEQVLEVANSMYAFAP